MKKTILRAIFGLALVGSLAMAQDKRSGKMMKDLGLTDDQRPQVQSILKEQREAMATARKNNASKQDIQALRQKNHDRLATVLNADQMKKLDEGTKKGKHRRAPKV